MAKKQRRKRRAKQGTFTYKAAIPLRKARGKNNTNTNTNNNNRLAKKKKASHLVKPHIVYNPSDEAQDWDIWLKRYAYGETFKAAILAEAGQEERDFYTELRGSLGYERDGVKIGGKKSEEKAQKETSADFLRRREKFFLDKKLCIITIDSETAKDFDDALSLQKIRLEGKTIFRLGVHIADVAAFVKEGSSLDEEAYHRGNSVYPPGCVIPMLPASLSEGVCSLHPGQLRLTLSQIIDIGQSGEVLNSCFKQGIILSHARLTYKQVQRILDAEAGREKEEEKEEEEEEEEKISPEVRRLLFNLRELKNIVRHKRKKEGSLFLNKGEQAFSFTNSFTNGEAGKKGYSRPTQQCIEKISLCFALESESIVEECMLLANQQAALFLEEEISLGRLKQAIYRVHGQPNQEELGAFQLAAKQTLEAKTMDGEYQQRLKSSTFFPFFKKAENRISLILESIEDTFEQSVLSLQFLRCLPEARYSTENIGHYGLAFKKYLHFTSPIRRYADLWTHRIIRSLLFEEKPGIESARSSKHFGERIKGLRPLYASLSDAARQISLKERKAIAAEREYAKLKTIRYALRNKQRVYAVFIISIMPRGDIFISCTETGIEGYVPKYEIESCLGMPLYAENDDTTGRRRLCNDFAQGSGRFGRGRRKSRYQGNSSKGGHSIAALSENDFFSLELGDILKVELDYALVEDLKMNFRVLEVLHASRNSRKP